MRGYRSSFTITVPTIPDTLGVTIDATPAAGVLPFSSQFWVQLTNLTSENRRAAARIDVTIGNGSVYNNWRAGWTNLGPGEVYSTNWNQNTKRSLEIRLNKCLPKYVPPMTATTKPRSKGA